MLLENKSGNERESYQEECWRVACLNGMNEKKGRDRIAEGVGLFGKILINGNAAHDLQQLHKSCWLPLKVYGIV